MKPTSPRVRIAPFLLSVVLLLGLAAAGPGCALEAGESGDDPTGTATEPDAPPREPDYPSAYASNCTCLFCVKYCQVNGVTEKGGTCC